MKAGLRQVMATMLKTDDAEPEGRGSRPPSAFQPRIRQLKRRRSQLPRCGLAVRMEAKVPLDSPSRQLLFVCHPASAADELPCATKILSRLAQRAYRRSANDDDVADAARLSTNGPRGRKFRRWHSRGAGARAGQPRFFVPHRVRSRRRPLRAPSYRVSDVELASRLSFFLWSSIPDDALLDLAIRGKLHEPAVLEQQVSRMFADPRARASLVQNFFSDWLQIRNVWLLNPDSTKFPWFDDNLRSAFVKETELFLDAQLKENHSVVDLLTSNETFLNEQLARHYGIPGIYGSHFRPVKLTDENRFGLLGKASVLAVTFLHHAHFADHPRQVGAGKYPGRAASRASAQCAFARIEQ